MELTERSRSDHRETAGSLHKKSRKNDCVVVKIASHLEYPEVQKDHNHAGDVKGSQRRVDDEIRIVESANEHRLNLRTLGEKNLIC